MNPKRQSIARFYLPDLLFAGESVVPLETGRIKDAVQAAKKVKSRHGYTPYAFALQTRIVCDPIPDGEGGFLNVEPKLVDPGIGRYYLGGQVKNYEEVVALSDEGERSIVAINMVNNEIPIVIYKYGQAHEFNEDDVVVCDDTGEIILRGYDPDLSKYRAEKIALWKKEQEERDS